MKRAFLFLLAFGTLVPFLPSFPGFFDEPELALGAHVLGVSHPTGHPAYMILAKAFSLISMGSIAFRTALVSLACALVATFILYELARELVADKQLKIAMTIGTACALVHPSLLLNAIRTEVYSLSYALSLFVLWILVRFKNTGDARYAYAAAFGTGLAFSTQPLLALGSFSTLLYALLFFRHEGLKLRKIFLSGAFSILGFLVYAYIPIRSSKMPVLNWDHPTTWSRFRDFILAKDFETFFHSPLSSRAFQDVLRADVLELLPWYLWPVIVLGLISLARRLPRREFIFWVLAFCGSVGPWLMKDFWLLNPDAHAYVMMAVALCLILSIAGVHEVCVRLPSSLGKVLAGLFFVLCFGDLARHSNWKMAFNEASPSRILASNLEILPPRAAVQLSSDHWVFPFWYASYVEGRRPDVAILARGLENSSWYQAQVLGLYGEGTYRPRLAEVQAWPMGFPVGLLAAERMWKSDSEIQTQLAQVCGTKGDPFEITSAVCSQIVLTTASNRARSAQGTAAVELLERFLDRPLSNTKCAVPETVSLPIPLAHTDRPQFLPSREDVERRLFLLYAGCLSPVMALKTIKSYGDLRYTDSLILKSVVAFQAGERDYALQTIQKITPTSSREKEIVRMATKHFGLKENL